MTLQRSLFLSAALLAILSQAVSAREWSDATGQFKTEAELVQVTADTVFLKKQSDGTVIQVPISRLSPADQAYLAAQQTPPAGAATSEEGLVLPLATENCVALLVIDPKPVLQQDALTRPPLKDLLDKGVEAAGLDFRTIDRVSVLFLKVAAAEAMAANNMPAVGIVQFAAAVDPAPMLSKLPTTYETTTIAGKTCHKPADKPNPWVCVIDEKTWAFAENEGSLTSVLTATRDNPELIALLQAADAKNEIRYVLNLLAMQDLLAQAKLAIAAQAPPDAVKMFELVAKIHSVTFTTDLDGPPAIELLLRTGDDPSAAELQKGIQAGLAQLPELAKSASAAMPQEPIEAGGMPVDPAMAVQMFGQMAEKIDELLAVEQQAAAVKLSVKFAPGTPPLAETIVQTAGLLAMLAQQSGQGGPFGPGN